MKSEVDKTIEEYDGYYEEIFKDFKEFAGNIIVEFKDLNEYKQKTFIPIVKSINGCINSEKFKRKLSLLKENSFDILQDILDKHTKRENIKFLKDLAEKVTELKHFVCSIEPFIFEEDDYAFKIATSLSNFKIKNEQGLTFDSFSDIELLNNKKIESTQFYVGVANYSNVLKPIIEDIIKGIKKVLFRIELEPEKSFIKPTTKKEAINKLNAKTSYELSDPAKQTFIITKLLQGLKKKGFLDDKSSSEDFKAIFTGYAKESVNWIGEGGLTEILYLLYLLWGDKEETTKYVIKPKQPYKNLKNCFIWKGYNKESDSYKTIYGNIKNALQYPSRAKDIDRLIESLK